MQRINKSIKLLLTLLFWQSISFAQEWTGTFNTNFGELKLVTENGLIYGDYASGGTIIAVEKKINGASVLQGIYHNGTDRGKFFFEKRTGRNEISGYYNHDNGLTLEDIKADGVFTLKFEFGENFRWTGTKINAAKPTSLKTALFNGQWNTNYGVVQLQQIGTAITGTYKQTEKINAVYNPARKTIEGTFTNTGLTGYLRLEAKLGGNAFSGKWGFSKEMKEPDSWTWNKVEKVNSIPTASASTNNPPAATTAPPTNTAPVNNNNSTNNNSTTTTRKFVFRFDYLTENSGYFFDKDVYGIGWCRLMIKHNTTQKLLMVNPHLSTYKDKYGRVYEVPRNQAIEMSGYAVTSLMNEDIYFHIRYQDYGYTSYEAMAENAFFEVGFEAKIKGGTFSSDVIVDKEFTRVPLAKATIEKASSQQLDNINNIQIPNQAGIINLKGDSYRFAVFFTLKKDD